MSKRTSDGDKVFNDPIHGHIDIPYICTRIIDTPQFQRLRLIKQLGELYYVFPGASHNRFEHSLGVCYLAGCMSKKLQWSQPEMNITDIDVLCVQIAGLCHDLGHGPFSHSFEKFLKMVENNKDIEWKHEKASVCMFDFLIEKNNLRMDFRECGFDEHDIIFIKELIDPILVTCVWPFKGRGVEKQFLYDIVANMRNGVDVDKFDYFARDCHHLGIKNSFDYIRLIKFARIINVPTENGDQFQICYREKEVLNLYDMFHTRDMLYRRAYHHKVDMAIQTMIGEVMLFANGHITFKGKDGALLTLSESAIKYDMEAFYKTNDYIIQRILDCESTHTDIVRAKELILRIQTRKLYKCVYTCRPKDMLRVISVEDFHDKLFEKASEKTKAVEPLKKSDILVKDVSLSYGQKDKDPIKNIRFYKKSRPDSPVAVTNDAVSLMAVPTQFSETFYYVYCKPNNTEYNQAIILSCSELEIPLGLTPIKTRGLRSAGCGDQGKVLRRINFSDDTNI